MNFKDVMNIWEIAFLEMGFQQNKEKAWVYETSELIILFSITDSMQIQNFDIDISIIIKKLRKKCLPQFATHKDHHIFQGLYGFLYALGSPESGAYKFHYNPMINTDVEIIDYIVDLVWEFKKEVIPYLDKLNLYASVATNFQKKTTWKPFLEYFFPNQHYSRLFKGELAEYLTHW